MSPHSPSKRHDFHGEWNYTLLRPTRRRSRAVAKAGGPMVHGGGSGLSLVVTGYNLGEHLYGQDDYFLSYLQPSPPGQPSVIDLRNVRFVDPLGLVGIATLAQSQRQAGRDVTLDGPNNSNVAAYLSRMRLNDALDYLGVG